MDALSLAQQLEAKVKAGKPTKVTKEFLTHFDAVCKYYQCPSEEVELMKAIARNDMVNAKVCFSSIYERMG